MMKHHHDESVILIIDDDQTNLNVIIDYLKIAGLTTITARNGEMGIKRAIFTHPDLILLDVIMPGIDGFETCRRLKTEPVTQDIPILFMTVLNDVENTVKGFDAGGVDYITKPIEEKEVLARVQTHLELQRARKAIEAQNKALIEAARLQEDLDRLMHHDLKTPLTVVIAYPQSILRNPHLTKEEREQLKMIEIAGYRMLRMINASQDLVKMERGRYQLQPFSVNLVQVLKKITAEISPLIQKKKLKLEVVLNGQPACDEDVFWVQGEDLLCYSMLANLLTNAIKASLENDVVTVSFAEEDMAIIWIHNTGGIAKELRDNFFEKYVTSGEDPQSSGLGTYSAKLMAETQNGVINMTSSEQEGTMITIRLPKGVPSPVDPAADSTPHRLEAPIRTPKSTIPEALKPEALDALPVEWLADLQRAAEEVDVEMITSVIAQIRGCDVALADALARLVEDFEYDEILALIQGTRKRDME